MQTPELYNITGIIERLERHFKSERIGIPIALVCCIGGNDFLPKFHGTTNEKWLTAFIETPSAPNNLLHLMFMKRQGNLSKARLTRTFSMKSLNR